VAIITCTVLVEVPDDELPDDAGSYSFWMAELLHNPDKGCYLVNHDYGATFDKEDFDRIKYSLIDEDGCI
jgi:hypothetical protein